MKRCIKHPACCVHYGIHEPGCAEFYIWANGGNYDFHLLAECHSRFSAYSDVNRMRCENCDRNVGRLTTRAAGFADTCLVPTVPMLVPSCNDPRMNSVSLRQQDDPMKCISPSAVTLTFMVSGMALAGNGFGWQLSFEDAERQATQQHVPLLMHFHSSWCGPCRQMDQQVFSSPVVQRALQEGLTAVKVDITERPDLKDRFGADSIPRDIVVYPDGTVETLNIGMVPMRSYLSLLRNTAARGRSIAMTRMDASEAEVIENRNRTVELVPVVQDATEDTEIVGLNGYCPVMLSGRKKWIRGQANLTERYRGVLYHFSGEKQRDLFQQNPDRYAPRNLGCDPVILFKEQRAVTGRIRYGAFFDGKLYLFHTAQSRTEFKRKPLRYTRIQHAIKPAELTGQTFR